MAGLVRVVVFRAVCGILVTEEAASGVSWLEAAALDLVVLVVGMVSGDSFPLPFDAGVLGIMG